jgi:hypothetical protein
MAHQSYAEEQTKIAKEVAFATLGRAIADGTSKGADVKLLLQDAAVRRQQEQNQGDRTTKFAALVRQVGDAINSGKPIDELLDQLVELRHAELS